jgi:hypothetical protein
MARLCERPGCSVPADVSYGFDAEHLVVWLDGFHAAQGASSGVLCRRHADAMVVPLGWMLDDRREPAPRLFRPANEAPTGPLIRPRVKRVHPDLDTRTVQLQLDDYERSTDLAAAVEDAVSKAIAVAIGQHVDLDLEPAMDIDVAVENDIDIDIDIDPADVDDHEDASDVLPWQPIFDETDDLQGLLKARGRLLSRAFNGVGVDDR